MENIDVRNIIKKLMEIVFSPARHRVALQRHYFWPTAIHATGGCPHRTTIVY